MPVALRLRPRETEFYDLFTRQAGQLVVGADLLAEAFATTDRKDVARRMRAAEHDADETTHEVVRRVNTTFVTPFDREDIYNLASRLDDIMDFMEEAVDLALLYGVTELPAGAGEQVDVLRQCAALTAEAMPRLRTMTDLSAYWIEINRLENEADRSYRRVLATLFGGEYDALEVLKAKDVVDSLEAAADAFESVANIVEQIAVKES
jgi:predicted phosphate transport protein (TIGR00153 family)